jgi:putative hemolysin
MRLVPLLAGLPLIGHLAHELAMGLVVVGITYLSLIFGELVPKRLALQRPEVIAAAMARPMSGLALVSAPFVQFLSGSTEAVLRLFGVQKRHDPPVTEEEIQGLMEQGMEAGVFEEHERTFVSRAFRLDDRKVPAIMTPSVDIAFVDLEDDLDINLRRIAESHHSRLPVCRGGLGNVVGILSARVVLERLLGGVSLDLEALVKPVSYIPATVALIDLLEHFKRHRSEIALVVNEFGDTDGLVTISDVLEAIVGDLPAEDEEAEADMVCREDGSWLIDGSVALDRLRQVLGGAVRFPEEELGGYHTLGGLMLTLLGRVPNVSDYFIWAGYRFEVVDMDRQRVDRVLVSRAPAEPMAVPPTAAGGAEIT